MALSKQEALSQIAALISEAGLSESELASLLPKPTPKTRGR